MSNYYSALVTRTVGCPRCRAKATLSYTPSIETHDEAPARQVVFLCPNMCTLGPDEVTTLLG